MEKEGQPTKQVDWWHEIFDQGVQLGWSINEWLVAIDRRLGEDVELDLNQLDSRGTTALHEAVKLRNNDAIYVLLSCGADINAQDSHGKTAPAYLPHTEGSPVLIHILIYIGTYGHLDLHVCEENRQWCRDRHKHRYGLDYSGDSAEVPFVDEVKKWPPFYTRDLPDTAEEIGRTLRDTRLDEQTTLAEVVSGAVSDAQLARQLDDLRRVVELPDFCSRFKVAAGLVKQRFRKALLVRIAHRKQLAPLARRAVEILFELPDVCNDIVVGYLSYVDLLNLLEAFQFECAYKSPERELRS